MSDFEVSEVVCKHDLYGGKDATTAFFLIGKTYQVRVFAKSAVVKDETGCLRELYNAKDSKFYKQYFKPMVNTGLGSITQDEMPDPSSEK